MKEQSRAEQSRAVLYVIKVFVQLDQVRRMNLFGAAPLSSSAIGSFRFDKVRMVQ
jgi:hypothetical protein